MKVACRRRFSFPGPFFALGLYSVARAGGEPPAVREVSLPVGGDLPPLHYLMHEGTHDTVHKVGCQGSCKREPARPSTITVAWQCIPRDAQLRLLAVGLLHVASRTCDGELGTAELFLS